MSRRKPRPLVHIGRGTYVHPTTARWLHLEPKPIPVRYRRTVRDLFR